MNSSVQSLCKQLRQGALASGLMLLGFFSSESVKGQVSVTATSGTGSGSYTTISDAFAAINSGTHKGVITLSITNNTTEPSSPTPLYGSGTASASSSSYTTVTIRPSGGNWTVNSASTPSSNRGVIELAGADSVIIDGDDPSTSGTRNLTILVAMSTNTTAAVRISSNSTSGSDGANSVTVKNCNITGSRNSGTSTSVSYGIVGCNYSTTSLTGGAYNSLNTVIENNNITRARHGVYMVGISTTYPNTGLRVRNNIIGNSVEDNGIGQYGIYCTYTATSTSSTSSAIIEGNDIQVGHYTTGVSFSVMGIYVGSYNYGMIIRRNNIHDIANSSTGLWGSYGIGFYSTLNNDIVIENNFIRDVTNNSNSSTPSYVYQNHGIYISSIGTGTKINHNTFYLNKPNATTYSSGAYTSTASSSCLTFTSSSSSISQLYNNIFINNLGGVSSNAYCVVTSGATNLPSGTNNNNYWAPSSGKIGFYGGSAISSLAAWQSATGLDAASISESVAFTSSTDLHIPTGTTSLCESGGASTSVTGVTNDIDNTTRPGSSTYGFGTAPDIGADEFNGQVLYTCTTPAPGATLASPASICLGGSVNLSFASPVPGTGVAYQWQSSPNGILPYTDIVGATAATTTVSPTAATYYRCKVKCKAGPDSSYSTPVQVTFTNNVLSASGSTRCGTGTANLTATGSSGSTLRWYSVPAGGAALGSGSPFTTPSISSTTSYYVAAETNSSGTGQIGSGTSLTSAYGYPTAFGNYWYQDWQQIVYTAAELSAAGLAAGNLTGLAMNITGLPSPGSISNYALRIGTTSSSTLSGFTTSGLSTVYGPSSITPVSGWNNITFSTPFYWDGTSNIIVDIRGDGAYGSANATTAFTTTAGNTCVFAYSYSSSPSFYTSSPTPSTSTSRPNIRFFGTLVCSSPRVEVIATVNTAPAFAVVGTQTVCNNTAATLSVATPLSNYTSYTWTPATGLFTDAACTVPYTSGASASTVYAKNSAAATYIYTANAFNSGTLCSGVDRDTVTNLPASLATVATPSSLCFSGSTRMTFTPSTGLGAAQFQWQSSANNTTWSDSTGMTGTSLTTPTVSDSRYYRVVLKSSTGAFCLNASSDTALVYKPSVIATTDAARCATGTVNLAASGTDGTLQWYASASGGSLLGTGSSFTTPIIGSTTTYYVQSRATDDQTFQIGSAGTSLGSTGLSPFSQYYESTRTQYLILASDLAAAGATAGQFATLAFDVSTKSSSLPFKGYTISLANTTATSLSGFLSPTFTTVYGPTNYTNNSGLNVLPLSGGFVWDGTSNLLVQVCFSNATGAYDGWSSDDVVKATTKSYTASYGTYADNAYFCSGGTGSLVSSSVLPDMQFTRLGCVSSRSPVVATVNPNPVPTISPSPGPINICDGYTTTLTGGGGSAYQWKNASGPIPGATTASYTTGTAGAYQVVVTNTTTGCKDSSASITVNVNPQPKVTLSPIGSTAICADSALAMTGTAIGTGLTYKWFRNDTAITGATGLTYAATMAGRYTFRAYLGTCADTSKELSLTVNALPASSFTKTGSTGAICLGSTLELTALSVPSGYKYQWFYNNIPISGASAQIYNAANAGYYKVRITDLNNCRKFSDSLMVIKTPMGVPPLSPVNASFCDGATIMLYSNAGPHAVAYAWTKDGLPTLDTTVNIVVNTSGWYDVTATDVYGCKATSARVRVDVLPGATKPVIVRSGMTLGTATVYSSYQWYRNGKAISGATNRYYTISFDGDYKVVVSNSNGCYNSSDVLKLNTNGVSELVAGGEIRLYPNPSDGIIHIESPLKVQVIVRDIQGRQVTSVKDATSIDLQQFSDGMYLFYILDEEGNMLSTEKIIKASH